MRDLNKVLGRVLAAERKRANLSQESLAFECGLHPTYVSQLERGLKSPTVRTLLAVAQALDIKASDILRRVEDVR